jgi:hypothetical protein
MRIALSVMLAVTVAAMAGCANSGYKVSRPYIGKMERVDQEVAGNRGYLKGTPPPVGERSSTRQLFAIDVDLPDRVSEKPVDTFVGKPGTTKTAEPGDVTPATNRAIFENAKAGEESIK